MVENLGKIHFVFRGGPDGSLSMLKKMREEGEKVLKILDDEEYSAVIKAFTSRMDETIKAVESGSKGIVDVSSQEGRELLEKQMVVFEGKKIPWGLKDEA